VYDSWQLSWSPFSSVSDLWPFFQLSEFHPSYLLQAIHLYGTRSSSSPNTSYFSYHYVAFHRNYHYSNFSKSILFRMSTLSKTVVLNLGLIEPQGYSESVPRVRQFCSLSSDPLCRWYSFYAYVLNLKEKKGTFYFPKYEGSSECMYGTCGVQYLQKC